MQNLPIGIQTFKKIAQENSLYVDKTKYIYNLLTQGNTYFISRPRRFGKSLLISTLDSIFQGEKKLFKNLWIYTSNYKWKKHPVIKIDFSKIPNKNEEEFKTSIKRKLVKICQDYKCVIDNNLSIQDIFSELIQQLAKINKVVILIDEYDHPLISNITNKKIAQRNRDILRSFYSIIKAEDANLRFVLLTGVSKFSKVSVFSCLNNLQDLTMSEDYSQMLGYTQKELEFYFKDRIKGLAKHNKLSQKESILKIKKWYNGYRFSISDNKVYNPFSTLLLFEQKHFKNYWFETGTPTFLINLIREKDFDIRKMKNLESSEIGFSTYEIEELAPLPLLFQTGYLTIAKYHQESMIYTLDYPNFEVKSAFLAYLMRSFAKANLEDIGVIGYKMFKNIQENNLEDFFQNLKIFFAKIPYTLNLKHEKYYQTIFYIIFAYLGANIQAEVTTNQGRIDATIETKTHIYIFEFKLHESKEKALKQIKEKKYYEKYLDFKKQIVLIGAGFNKRERNIEAW